MISREFIYEFSNFDDIKSRENDKKSRAHDIFRRKMGVRYKFKGVRYRKVGAQTCTRGLRSRSRDAPASFILMLLALPKGATSSRRRRFSE